MDSRARPALASIGECWRHGLFERFWQFPGTNPSCRLPYAHPCTPPRRAGKRRVGGFVQRRRARLAPRIPGQQALCALAFAPNPPLSRICCAERCSPPAGADSARSAKSCPASRALPRSAGRHRRKRRGKAMLAVHGLGSQSKCALRRGCPEWGGHAYTWPGRCASSPPVYRPVDATGLRSLPP